jgi:glycosyltransferase involved in cell wall biosynthesis
MKKAPRVSVVTPIYNSAAYLASTVESVRAQTFPDWELVLSDDGSSDSSVTIAKEFASHDSRIRVVEGNHGGISSARNQGFQETHPESEFVAFLDSDDTWEPEALELLVGELERHPECPAAHGLARAVDAEGRQFADDDLTESMRQRREIRDRRYVDLSVSAPTSFQAELVQNYVVTPGTSLIRRRVLAPLGGFAPATDPCEDWDMNLRIARHGGFALVDRVILNWRRHPRSISNTAGKRWRRAHLAVLQRAILAVENTPEQQKAAEFALLARCRESAAGAGQELAHGRVRSSARALMRASLYLSVYCRSYGAKWRL